MYKLRTFVSLVVLTTSLAAAPSSQADDLKEIAQLSSQGQSGVALERINTHLATNPKDVQALFLKGVISADLRKTDEAVKIFKEITEKYPNLPEPYNNLAVLYADMGQYDKAQKALEAAIKTHPSYATAHENLGDVYAKMASEAYDKALKLDNKNTGLQGKLSLIKELVPAGGKPAVPVAKAPATGTIKTAALPAVAAQPTPAAAPIKPALAVPAKPAVAAVQPPPVVTTAPAKPVAAPAVGAAASKPAEAAPVADSKVELEQALDQWVKAWSAKDVNAYLASYAPSFKAPDGLDRKQWENARRIRISYPSRIRVKTDNIDIKQEGADLARVAFDQTYRADGDPKFTPKTLVMRKIDGKWLIEQELTNR